MTKEQRQDRQEEMHVAEGLRCIKNNNEENEIFIDIENKTDSVSFYEHFKGASIIPLETNETCLIQEVTRKVYSDSTYYIFDEPQKCIFAFSYAGKYKFKIKNIGRGPGEFTKIVDFDINKYKNSIDILSQTGKILQYNKSGTFIGSYNLPNSINAVHHFKSISKDTIAFYQMFEQEKVFFYSISKKRFLMFSMNCQTIYTGICLSLIRIHLFN